VAATPGRDMEAGGRVRDVVGWASAVVRVVRSRWSLVAVERVAGEAGDPRRRGSPPPGIRAASAPASVGLGVITVRGEGVREPAPFSGCCDREP
jgi:hypothetical protein